MRSLFLKIFLWFWVTLVLVGAALVITWGIQPEVIVARWRGATGDALALYAQSAAEVHDRYGQAALNDYFRRLETTSKIHAALYDDKLQLIGGNVSATARDVASHAGPGGEPAFSFQENLAYGAQRTQGPSGRSYILATEMPRGPFSPLRRLVGTQYWRWVAAVLISGIICYLLTWYLTRPVLRLQEATHELAGGNLSARAAPGMERRRDEIGDLVRDFNLMAAQIEALLTSQRQLISDISHELRSPLARLNVALGLARQRAGQDAQSSLDRIEREADRLNEMIGKLLALARMEGVAGPPEKSEISLQELVQEIAADAGFEAQERNCTVRITSTHPCVAQGSPELLRSAIENVVRNAVRYTAPGTAVEIALNSRNGHAEIDVRDHGPGVPEAELANLFRPFYRLATARERESGGTGLGLAITERTVRLHGGSVRAVNVRDNGGGLRVSITLPAHNSNKPS